MELPALTLDQKTARKSCNGPCWWQGHFYFRLCSSSTDSFYHNVLRQRSSSGHGADSEGRVSITSSWCWATATTESSLREPLSQLLGHSTVARECRAVTENSGPKTIKLHLWNMIYAVKRYLKSVANFTSNVRLMFLLKFHTCSQCTELNSDPLPKAANP